jgi:8-oxo-dGTP diphosphatase
MMDAMASDDDAPLWPGAPEFGTREAGVDYCDRPGAYAILLDPDGRVGVILTPCGVWLPGGGCAADESDASALRRELIEECGLDCTLLRRLGEAIEYVHAPAEAAWFRKRGVFFLVRPGAVVAAPTETDHALVWLAPGEAVSRLSHRSQSWALSRWLAVGG